ncbi:hypothetical protein [Vampirovibrio sp.]|uniref:hypothetical protein n=1 Tax=Vampirovibrio sp. TaxID=2717857 RepID=UPI003592F7C7
MLFLKLRAANLLGWIESLKQFVNNLAQHNKRSVAQRFFEKFAPFTALGFVMAAGQMRIWIDGMPA